ncbi:hypothetical protein Saso_04300 [Streptomyces asoensis]|uniref:Uncharacterized protein n=1 Tax=Streptomyces asoensis TaxID=249586 RepID=A0ABQ3RSE2_9ACTN|nr:hypothetical protein GCM10010496_05220 [Streptomyces asoensis]GHI58780.1 hypothetical protein Saso_04300 [Streptomyces asoensis]
MLHEAAEETGVDFADGEGGVEGETCGAHERLSRRGNLSVGGRESGVGGGEARGRRVVRALSSRGSTFRIALVTSNGTVKSMCPPVNGFDEIHDSAFYRGSPTALAAP